MPSFHVLRLCPRRASRNRKRIRTRPTRRRFGHSVPREHPTGKLSKSRQIKAAGAPRPQSEKGYPSLDSPTSVGGSQLVQFLEGLPRRVRSVAAVALPKQHGGAVFLGFLFDTTHPM